MPDKDIEHHANWGPKEKGYVLVCGTCSATGFLGYREGGTCGVREGGVKCDGTVVRKYHEQQEAAE